MQSPVPPEFLENAEDILGYLRVCQDQTIPCALCVVTGVSGGSSRAVGTLVAVRMDGEMAGYVSHGCVDADLCVQAQTALKRGAPVEIVYGVGSPFMDLKLPCGGTLEVLIDPTPNGQICRDALTQLIERNPISLIFHPKKGLVASTSHRPFTGWDQETFVATHQPVLRLIIGGKGPTLAAAARIGAAMDVQMSICSPDEKTRKIFSAFPQTTFTHLKTPAGGFQMGLDRWCAVLLLFHDHDWEPGLLGAALESDAFYIGALGSSKTHANRLHTLAAAGLDHAQLARIKGPIGVIPAARDAYTLAVSAYAEILDAYRNIPSIRTENPEA